MKRKVLLFSLSACMIALALSSYKTGPFQGGAGNRTGSAGSPASCASGCHANNSTNTQFGLGLTTLTGGIVTAYTPGTTYKVVITGTNSSALPKFGFQASCVKAAATSTQAGSFTSTAANVSVRTSGSMQFAEHNTPIAAIGVGGGSAAYQVSFNWTAPAAGTGTVRFYATLNAVNGDNTDNGDQPNTLASPFDLQEGAASIESITRLNATVYPNPANSELHIKLDGVKNVCTVQIHDISGRIVASQQADVSNGEAVAQIGNLRSGAYYLIVNHDDRNYLAPFVKH